MKRLSLAALALASVAALHARPFTVVTYNVENLVDADGVAGFAEYQPPRYTPAHTLTKLQNIARVVAQFDGGRGPDVLLLCELEVDQTPAAAPLDYDAVLRRHAGTKIEELLGPKLDRDAADLPAEALLLKALADRGMSGYHVAIGENITAAGTERKLEQRCAIFTRFPIRAARSHPTLDARAILEVQLEVDGALLYVFANHWKSGAGDPQMEVTRRANAQTLRTRLDEILKADAQADIIIGGDLNSQYNQRLRYPAMKTTAINDVLGAQGNELAIRGAQRDLYNLWYELPATERGSDTYGGEWGTLMHLIVSRGLYDFRGVQYVDNSFGVAKFPGINVDAQGLPARWEFEGKGSGFSDHLPIYAKFITVADNRPDRYLALQGNAGVERTDSAEVVKIGYAALDLEKLAAPQAEIPPGTSIRADAFKKKIFRVEGRVADSARLAVEFRGETYDVWSFNEALRNRLRADYKAGDTLKFYGELGQYRDRWQFVIQDPNWVK